MPSSFAPDTLVGAFRFTVNRLASSFVIVIFSAPMTFAQAEPLTLEQAWVRAEQSNSELRAAEAGLPAARGQLTDTRGVLWNNPQIASDLARGQATLVGLPNESYTQWHIGLSQTFELAGQHGYRQQAAQLDLEAIGERIAELRRQIRAEVEQRYIRLLALQQRAEIDRDALKQIEDAAVAVRKRVGAGEDSRLDGNLASIESERARNQLTVLGEQIIQARVDLATIVQLPPNDLPESVGELTGERPRYSLQNLLDNAATRPLIRAINLREQAARNRLALERAAVYPDITVGLAAGREGPGDSRNNLTILSVSVPLPLFKRNASGVGRATTELTQTQIEKQTAKRDSEVQVRALWQRRESLQARVDRFTESMLPKLDENQRLSTTSYRAGEIGLLQLLLVNRQVIDGRRDLLDARAELRLTTIALEAAAGWLSDGSRK